LAADNESIERPVLNPARQKKAREYSRIRRRLGFVELGLYLSLLLILTFSGFSKWFTSLFNLPSIIVAVIFFITLIVAIEILTSPISYYSGFVLPHRYGISIQKYRNWLVDQVKSGIISLVFGTVAVVAAYWLLQNFPDYWWIIAWALMVIVSVLMTIIGLVFLIPLFYKVKPLAESELKSRLEELAQKAQAKVQGIFVLDYSNKVTAANAALMGIGRTRRIVVSDTLIQQYTIPEIEAVTAHEIGHHNHRDIFRMFMIQSVLYLIVFKLIDVVFKAAVFPLGFGGIADPAALPLLALILGVFSALVSPIMNSYSRHIESQADEYALILTSNTRAFIDAMTRLVNQNLAVASPAIWEELLLYDHPSYNRRVTQAKRYEKSK